jgi:signal transduction histidine kinase
MPPINMRKPSVWFHAPGWLLVFLLPFQMSFAQDKPSFKWGRPDLLSIDTTWKYKPGLAKPEYFDPKFDDQQWQTIGNIFLDTLSFRSINWSGTGVFRKKFTVPDSLKNRRAEFFFGQSGASEIYLDGKLVCRFGIVAGATRDEFINQKAVQIELDSQSSHQLVVYHSNHIDTSIIKRFEFTGYGIKLSIYNPADEEALDMFTHAVISVCIILSFCLFFLFVYGFYPFRLASLMSALYLANFSLIFIGALLTLSTNVKTLVLGNDIWNIGFDCNPCWNLLFLYSIYYKKIPRRSWILVAIMTIFVSFVFFATPLPLKIVVPILILIALESWRIIILGLRNKRTGFWIIAIGTFISLIGSFVAIFDAFNFFPWYLTTTQIILAIVTDLSFPLTLSLQLAWEFGTSNRDLRRQLAHVNDLSRKNLEQEQEKQQILAEQNEMLEKQVAERTHEVVSQKREIENQRDQVTHTLGELRSTQNQLIQSEKMASLGELTAGIAHEIQNPLNFVNNFSELNTELIEEMNREIDSGNLAQIKNIASDLGQNTEKITHHGKRADAIVKGMLLHSRKSTGQKEPTDINALTDEYLRLSYHGLRAQDKSFNSNMETSFDETLDKINIIPQDIGRVLLNLFNNAFYAVNEKRSLVNQSADPINPAGKSYEPLVSVSTKKTGDKVEIRITDNGTGIPQKVVDKIFQPFFTTKPTGQGTGLGLSLSYDIIKISGGTIEVQTQEGNGTTFIIQLPVN